MTPPRPPKQNINRRPKSIHQYCAKGSPTNALKALWCIFFFFSLESKLFGFHQTSFLPVEALEFSELKTPLGYTFFPSEVYKQHFSMLPFGSFGILASLSYNGSCRRTECLLSQQQPESPLTEGPSTKERVTLIMVGLFTIRAIIKIKHFRREELVRMENTFFGERSLTGKQLQNVGRRAENSKTHPDSAFGWVPIAWVLGRSWRETPCQSGASRPSWGKSVKSIASWGSL